MKPQKKMLESETRSHRGSLGASFCALPRDFSLHIFLLFLRPRGGNHGHWPTVEVLHLLSRGKTWQGLGSPGFNSKCPCKGLWLAHMATLRPVNCVLATGFHNAKDCPWYSTIAMWKGQGRSQRRGAGQTTQGWIYTFGLESAWQAAMRLSFPKESSDQDTFTQQLDLSCRVASPTVTPRVSQSPPYVRPSEMENKGLATATWLGTALPGTTLGRISHSIGWGFVKPVLQFHFFLSLPFIDVDLWYTLPQRLLPEKPSFGNCTYPSAHLDFLSATISSCTNASYPSDATSFKKPFLVALIRYALFIQ